VALIFHRRDAMTAHTIARSLLVAAALVVSSAASGWAQPLLPDRTGTVGLSGPRFGLTMLSQSVVDKLAERDIEVGPQISQFGWQFERQFFSKKGGGVTAVSEWVALVGGLDQGVVLPSVSWLIGLRTRDGAEFGVGPNVTPAGAALAFAAGMTFRGAAMNIPVNVAVVPAKSGVRVSLLSGFSFRNK
jgi:hypothetical protein